jgi:hypothetical protein
LQRSPEIAESTQDWKRQKLTAVEIKFWVANRKEKTFGLEV